MSLKDYADVIAYPPKFFFVPTLDNYIDVLFGSGEAGAGEFRQYMLNSVIVSGGAVILSLAVGVPAAFALSRNRVRGADHFAFTFLSLRFAPELAVIIPLYAIFQQVRVYDTYIGMILSHQLITIPLVIWIVRTFLADVPIEIEEASQLDGCGPWRTLFGVVVPIIRPGIASAAILAFIFSWNNLLMGLVLSGPNTRPVTVGILQAIGFDQVRWGWMAAAAMIAAIPGMIIAVYLQRHLVRGLTMGVGK
ncbi:carbohydrate ABC transporter permease [Microbacterium sp. PAMC22086]|uniref:carbohydrate ABC transporter permease n=1 Tax=Microbacterium sp. PAMC22086 TaxID=2861281 RepID=UPI001C638048|nr:carbohydrate ABC transporter permease [Microbacterium sp. PAMC22086]QYG13157.1 carbohydrate ABC transporter permease [Microbacterium sp. PAMC22086]